MKRVLVLVEGQTEERFIKEVLNPHLWSRDITTIPTIVTTKRVKHGPDFKGGITNYPKVEHDLLRLLGDSGTVAVTTFIDYYALPSNFPGMYNLPKARAIDRVQHVEAAWRKKINHKLFYPYLMVHEFEALLFCKPDELGRALRNADKVAELESIRKEFLTPEDINDNPETAPSKRILKVLPGYRKPLHGPLITKRIGIEKLQKECPHFNEWLTWIERV